MSDGEQTDSAPDKGAPVIPHSDPAGGTGSLEAAMMLEKNPIKRFLKVLGPGLVTGASDDDPSGIGTYAVAGASLGFTTLWTALFTWPLMASVQLTCARIGMVSGMGLASVLRRHYARNLLYLTVCGLVIANTINAGADIGAIAAAINLLIPIPITVLVLPIALIILALQIWGSYRLIARTFKWLTLALFAYIGSAFFAKPDAIQVLKATFIPTLSFDATFLATLVAILGNQFWPRDPRPAPGRDRRRTEIRCLGREYRHVAFECGDVLHYSGDGRDAFQSGPDQYSVGHRCRPGAQASGRQRRFNSARVRFDWQWSAGRAHPDWIQRVCFDRGPWGEIWLQSKTLSSQTLLWRDYRFYFDRSGD